MLRHSLTLIVFLALSPNINAAHIGYAPFEPIMSVGDTVGSGGLVGVSAEDLFYLGVPVDIFEVSYSATYSYDISGYGHYRSLTRHLFGSRSV